MARLDAQRSPTPEDARSNRAGGAVGRRLRADCRIGGLTERKGARLLSDGRGRPRQRSIRCPSALEGMPRWLGAPCFENSDTVLPWGFDTSTFRSLAARACSGSTPGLHRGGRQDRNLTLRHHRPDAHLGPSRQAHACGGQHTRKAGGSVPRGGTWTRSSRAPCSAE